MSGWRSPSVHPPRATVSSRLPTFTSSGSPPALVIAPISPLWRGLNTVKIQRLGLLASVALVGSLALTACGSDNNAGSSAGGSGSASSSSSGSASSSATAASDCPTGGGTLNAEGSSAQKNAIDEAISSFQDKCQGTTINYNPTGSGAGIKQFIAGQVDFAGSD